MIAKRIDRKSLDRFGRLAEYIAAAEDDGEKLHALWITGCDAGETPEDLALAIKEVEATQRQNKRSRKDKTYHLLISFRDEKPDLETLKQIEQAFAEALGFADHQRVVGTHQNTGNFHMHVAYNKVHPQTLRNRTPHRDFHILERMSRELEQRFGLKVDLGLSDKADRDLTPKARDMEAHTWQESFERHVKALKPELIQALDKATSWQDLHDALAQQGLLIKKRGNGLAIVDADGKQAIKASTLDRRFSAKALRERLGPFQRPVRETLPAQDRPPIRSRYKRRPLVKHPNNARLWRRYLGLKRRPDELRPLSSWKQFLMLQLTLEDPLAVAIVMYRQKMLEAVLGENKRAPEARVGKLVTPKWLSDKKLNRSGLV
ncbi:hypothetical protein JCM17960_19220 [Magnetospira thiophila]